MSLPSWLVPLAVLTADDLVASGACQAGVRAWCEKHAPDATALPVDRALLVAETVQDEDAIARIRRAARLDGDGDGDGYGYGDGYGDGYGYGYGDGDGRGR